MALLILRPVELNVVCGLRHGDPELPDHLCLGQREVGESCTLVMACASVPGVGVLDHGNRLSLWGWAKVKVMEIKKSST